MLTKHLPGKHNQKTHGRGGAARATYGATYHEAIAGGATHAEARQRARVAGRTAVGGGGDPHAVSPETVTAPTAPAAIPEGHEFASGREADKALIAASSLKADDLDYATQSALQHYQHNGYKDINGGLRTGDKAKLRENKSEIEKIDNVLSQSRTTQPLTTHRAMVVKPGSPAAAMLEQMVPGAEFREMGYMSTTVDKRRLSGFVKSIGGAKGAQQVNMRVHVPTGSKAAYMNAIAKPRGLQDYREERELLIARGSRFRVVSRSVNASGGIDMDVELMP